MDRWTPKGIPGNLLKECLTSTPVLGYPDFSHPFDLKTDAKLQGLGAVLSQRDEHGQSRVIVYASWSFHPNKRKMRTYISAKLELLALKWAVAETLLDYHLGSMFTMYTDNNPLGYVRRSKLGVTQIGCLSKLVLFDFDIEYRTGKSNKARMLRAIIPMSQRRWTVIQNQSNMETFGML